MWHEYVATNIVGTLSSEPSESEELDWKRLVHISTFQPNSVFRCQNGKISCCKIHNCIFHFKMLSTSIMRSSRPVKITSNEFHSNIFSNFVEYSLREVLKSVSCNRHWVSGWFWVWWWWWHNAIHEKVAVCWFIPMPTIWWVRQGTATTGYWYWRWKKLYFWWFWIWDYILRVENVIFPIFLIHLQSLLSASSSIASHSILSQFIFKSDFCILASCYCNNLLSYHKEIWRFLKKILNFPLHMSFNPCRSLKNQSIELRSCEPCIK